MSFIDVSKAGEIQESGASKTVSSEFELKEAVSTFSLPR